MLNTSSTYLKCVSGIFNIHYQFILNILVLYHSENQPTFLLELLNQKIETFSFFGYFYTQKLTILVKCFYHIPFAKF